MITLGSLSDQEKVLDALDDPDGVRARTVLFFDRGADNYGEVFTEGNWGQSDTSIGLECVLGTVLGRRRENAQVQHYVSVNGVLIPQMRGVKSTFLLYDDYASVKLNAATGGALFPDVKLQGLTEYREKSPQQIAQDALYKVADVGGYDKAFIELDSMDTPLLTFADGSGFKAQESVGDIISRVTQQVPSYTPRDNVYNGVRMRIDQGIGDPQSAIKTYSSMELPNWRPPARDPQQYSEVQVYREDQDGTDAYRETAAIVYVGLDNPPIQNTPLQIPLNDETSFGPFNAQTLANQQADLLIRGLYKGQDLYLPRFHPLIEVWDSIKIDGPQRDEDGLWHKVWFLRVDAYRHQRVKPGQTTALSNEPAAAGSGTTVRNTGDPAGFSTKINYTATILEEDLIKTPAYLGLTLSPQVLASPPLAITATIAGVFYEPSVAQDLLGHPWVYLDPGGTGAYIDSTYSGGAAYHDGSTGFYFEL